MFQFSGFPSPNYAFISGYTVSTLYEFPHSDISGLMVACTSPKLFAAYHVLHRLQAPRHSPYALSYLIALFENLLSLTFAPLEAPLRICLCSLFRFGEITALTPLTCRKTVLLVFFSFSFVQLCSFARYVCLYTRLALSLCFTRIDKKNTS